MKRCSLRFVAAAALLFAGEVAAHDVWLDVTPHDAPSTILQMGLQVGDRADVRLLVGHGSEDSEPVARNEGLIADFTAQSPTGDVVPVPGLHGMDPAGVFRPDRAGLWSVRYVGRPVEHRLDSEAFEAYLLEEGLEQIVEARREAGDSPKPGRELFSRSLEVLVPVSVSSSLQAPSSRAPSSRAPSSQASSLQVQSSQAQSVLPVRFRLRILDSGIEIQLLADGEPVADALADLRRDGVLVGSVRTGEDGSFASDLDDSEPATWVVTAVVMGPIDDPRADWRTIFAALTFPWPRSLPKPSAVADEKRGGSR